MTYTEAKKAFLSAFYSVVENDYTTLATINSDWPDVNDYDRDDIRVDFSNAIIEAADMLGLPCYTVEEEGELADLILESGVGLNEYLIDTME